MKEERTEGRAAGRRTEGRNEDKEGSRIMEERKKKRKEVG